MRLSAFQLPVEHLSATALTEFLNCAEMFRLKRLVRKPERYRADMFFGTVFHRTVADVFRARTDSLSAIEIATLYQHAWADTLSENGEPEWDKAAPSDMFENGGLMLASFMQTVLPLVTPDRVEERFEERVPGVPVPIVGYIDAESEQLIHEFKTASQKNIRPKPRWRFQGRIYQLAVDKPVAWYVTTKQVTPVSYTPVDNPELLMEATNKDATVRLVVQAVEQLNDMYARYGPDTPWPTNGQLHEWMCKSGCSYGPVGPNPSCVAWSKPRGNGETHDALAS